MKVIIIIFDHLIMICIINSLKNLHYLFLMINNVMKVTLKVNHGIEINCILSGKILQTLQKLNWPNF